MKQQDCGRLLALVMQRNVKGKAKSAYTILLKQLQFSSVIECKSISSLSFLFLTFTLLVHELPKTKSLLVRQALYIVKLERNMTYLVCVDLLRIVISRG